MPIDPSIALQLRPAQVENPLTMYGNALQVQQLHNQNREKMLESEQTNALNRIYQESLDDDGKIDRNKLYTGVAQGGMGSKLPALQKQFADVDKEEVALGKTKAETGKIDFETAKARADYGVQKMTGILALPVISDKAVSVFAQDLMKFPGADPGSIMEGVAAMPPESDQKGRRAYFESKLRGVMAPKEQMGYLKADANTLANNAVAMRGQNMTDARARDANSKGHYDSERGLMVDRQGVARPVLDASGIPLGAKEKAPTEFQGKSATYGARAEQADKIISDLDGKYSPAAVNSKQAAGDVWVVGGALEAGANALLSKDAQKAEQAQRDFLNAVLRQESGAAIGATEFDNGKKQYFPQPGDSKDVLAQKSANRKLAIQGFKNNAGRAAFSAPQNETATKPNQKQIGGVTYENDGNGWYKVQ